MSNPETEQPAEKEGGTSSMIDLETALAEAARLAEEEKAGVTENQPALVEAEAPTEATTEPELAPATAGTAPIAAAASGSGDGGGATIAQMASSAKSAPPSPARQLGADEEVRPAELQEFGLPADGTEPGSGSIGVLSDVVLPITVELGRVSARIREILTTGPGSIIELDRLSTDPVDVLAGGRLIARGEVVVVGKSMGVRITELAEGSG